jgi:uncharacterized protein YdhG (YjbR/CyaY superfamily)
MKQKINTFDEYKSTLNSSQEIAFVDELRKVALKHLSTYTETFDYGFPVYDGKGKFGFAIRKNSVSIYFHHNKISLLIDKYSEELGKYNFGKDTLSFKKMSDVPIDIIEKIILDIFEK